MGNKESTPKLSRREYNEHVEDIQRKMEEMVKIFQSGSSPDENKAVNNLKRLKEIAKDLKNKNPLIKDIIKDDRRAAVFFDSLIADANTVPMFRKFQKQNPGDKIPTVWKTIEPPQRMDKLKEAFQKHFQRNGFAFKLLNDLFLNGSIDDAAFLNMAGKIQHMFKGELKDLLYRSLDDLKRKVTKYNDDIYDAKEQMKDRVKLAKTYGDMFKGDGAVHTFQFPTAAIMINDGKGGEKRKFHFLNNVLFDNLPDHLSDDRERNLWERAMTRDTYAENFKHFANVGNENQTLRYDQKNKLLTLIEELSGMKMGLVNEKMTRTQKKIDDVIKLYDGNHKRLFMGSGRKVTTSKIQKQKKKKKAASAAAKKKKAEAAKKKKAAAAKKKKAAVAKKKKAAAAAKKKKAAAAAKKKKAAAAKKKKAAAAAKKKTKKA